MKSWKPNASTARWVRRAALSSTALSALALTAVLSGPAMAANIVWQGTTTDFNTNTNWNPNTVPASGDTAFFESDGSATVTFANATNTVNGFQISDKVLGGTTFTEKSFTFNIGSAAPNIVTIQGAGIINTGTQAQIVNLGGTNAGNLDFSNGATAGDASITYNVSGLTGGGGGPFGGAITFHNTSDAGGTNILDGTVGGATFKVSGGTASGGLGGTIDFFDTSSGSSGKFTASGGNTGGSGATITFHDGSTAATSHFTASAALDSTAGSTGGTVAFTDGASAGTAIGTAVGGNGLNVINGAIVFRSTSTAAFSVLDALGAANGGLGGVVLFTDTATAGNATITAHQALDAVGGSNGGFIFFRGSSNAGSAILQANTGTINGSPGGTIDFSNSSSAGSSHIQVNGGAGTGLLGGRLNFFDNSNAGTSQITINGFFGDSDASQGQATFGGAGLATAASAFITNHGILTFATGGAAGDSTIDNTNQVRFTGTGDGGTAHYSGLNSNATLDITGVVNPATQVFPGVATIANIVNLDTVNGFGSVLLGGNNLVVGGGGEGGAGTYFGTFGGAGTTDNIVKVGTGKWVLDGITPANQVGGFEINNGTVQIGDRFNPGATFNVAGSVTIDPNGTLSGHGTLNAATITNNGTVAPGGTIGTLTVSTYTQTSGGLLEIEVAPLTNSLLVVTPNGANLDGTVGFSFDKGIYNAPHLITFLTAAGGTTGTFSTLNSTALPSGGQPLKIITIGPSGGPNNTLDLVFAPGSALGGTGLPSIATGLLDQSQDITNLIFRHLQDGRGGTGGSASAALMPQLAYAGLSDQGAGVPDQVAAGPGGGWASGPRVWVRPFGREADTSTSGFNTGFRDQGGGVVAGIDQRLDGGFLVGVAGAYSHDDFKTSVSGTKGSTDSWRVTGYGSWESGPFAIDAQGGYTHDSIKTTRTFGPPVGTASASHGGDEGHAAVEGSYRADFGSANVIPWVGFNYVHLSEDAFTETGAHNFNLQVASHSNDSAQFQAGIRLNTTIHMDGGWSLTPEARLGVSEELASTSRTVTAVFPGVPQAGSLLLTGVAPDRTAGIAGVGLVAKANQSLDLTSFKAAGDVRLPL